MRQALEAGGLEAGKRQLDFLSEVFSRKLAVESTLVTERDREYVSQQLGLLAKQADLPLVATTAARAADLRSLRKSHVLRAIQMQGSLSQVEPIFRSRFSLSCVLLRIWSKFISIIQKQLRMQRS